MKFTSLVSRPIVNLSLQMVEALMLRTVYPYHKSYMHEKICDRY